jgi:thiol:disulfide interchange protein DsbD
MNALAIGTNLVMAIAVGILTVITPFIYSILPVTIRYLAPKSKGKEAGRRNIYIYAATLVLIFASLGVLLSVIANVTGLFRFTAHWLFNFALCRLFLGLGISLLGAFEFKLPASWANAASARAKSGNVPGIMYMALTLPAISFSSIIPMMVVALLTGHKSGTLGPFVSLLGFSVGLGLPFLFPKILEFLVPSKAILNKVKVLMGFIALTIGFKFLSRTDIALEWHLIDRDTFLIVIIIIASAAGAYLLGFMKLSQDYAPAKNLYGISYVSLPNLFMAIALFSLVFYLLPGIWGAPLQGINSFLPPL